jgi:hypothetical protein
MGKVRGVVDLANERNVKPKELRTALESKDVKGNWGCYRNMYNLINGISIPDPKAFIVMAEYFNVSLNDMVLRYSHGSYVETKDIEDKGIW